MPADPKPAPRTIDRQAGLAKLAREGGCRVCSDSYGLQRHHLVPRSLGGDDIDANLIPLCARCHDLWEHGTWHRAEVGALIRMFLTAAEEDYVMAKLGPDRFDHYYPAGTLR